VTDVAVHPTNPDVAWASSGAVVYKTIDGGVTWTPTTASPFGGTVTLLAVNPATPSTLFASLSPGSISALLKSTDGGSTWGIARLNFTANGFGFVSGSPSTVLAVGIGGLLASKNGGTTWFDLTTSDIPYAFGTAIAVVPPSVYIGVLGHSVWRRSIAPCTSAAECGDSNACTTDVCDPSNVASDLIGCVHAPVTCPTGVCETASCNPTTGCSAAPAPDTTPCTDDGSICTTDLCRSGTCAHEPHVVPGCRVSTKPRATTIALKSVVPAKATLAWKWKKGQDTALGALGDPFTAGASDYTLCGFDRSGAGATYALRFSVQAPAGGTCAGKDCWTASGTKIKYHDKDRTPDGADTLLLVPGADGAAKISMTAKGSNLALPSDAFAPDVLVQLRRDDAFSICWEATFNGTIQKNVPGLFRAKSD
jgi:hypothetical protein